MIFSADTGLTADIRVSVYRQHILIADTDTADTEKCADISDTDTGIGPSLVFGYTT